MKRKLTSPKFEAFQRPGRLEWEISPAVEALHSSVRAVSEDERTLNITDEIGDRGDGRGVTVNFVRGALRRMGRGDITVNINSKGGDYFSGLAIFNMLREHDGAVNANVIGIAASAASVIAMASDTLRVAKAGFLMIHNSHAIAIGNRHDMQSVADLLEQFDGAMAGIYAERTGIDQKKIAALMDAETFLAGEKAVEMKFADELLASDYVESAEPEKAAKGAMPRAGELSGTLANSLQALLSTIRQ